MEIVSPKTNGARREQVTAYLTVAEIEAVRKLAEADNRSISDWLRLLIRQRLNEFLGSK